MIPRYDTTKPCHDINIISDVERKQIAHWNYRRTRNDSNNNGRKIRRETRRIKNRIYANPTHLWIVILDYSAHVATRYITRVKSSLLLAVYIE